MSDVIDLDAHRMKRRLRGAADWASTMASCFYCGAEYPWGRRHDHSCQDSPTGKHPSLQ